MAALSQHQFEQADLGRQSIPSWRSLWRGMSGALDIHRPNQTTLSVRVGSECRSADATQGTENLFITCFYLASALQMLNPDVTSRGLKTACLSRLLWRPR
jgi:hypothetical protein